MNKYNTKFSFNESLTNSNGKTSGSGMIGILLGIITALSWIALIISFYLGYDADVIIELLKQTLALGVTSALLLGTRMISAIFDKENNQV